MNLKDLAELPLQDETGKPVSLADFIGKRTLIFTFPRADTPGCTTQACGFRDAFPKIEDAGAVVLGLSNDAPAALAKWKQKKNLPYTLLSDPDHRVLERLGVWGERSMMGRKFMGTIRSHFVFDEAGELTTSEVKVSPVDSVAKGTEALLRL